MRMLVGIAVLILAIVVLAGTGTAPAYAGGIEDKIATAKTAGDHEAIAKWFDEQAKDAEEKAAEHKKMAEAYRKAGGALSHKTRFQDHCDGLVSQYNGEAKEYRALAAAHREMAKGAK